MPANTDEREEFVKRSTYDLQATPRSFPFLKLPAEIRNSIYRLVLVRENVSTEVLEVNPWESQGGAANTGEVSVGAICCKCNRAYTTEFQISILRTNRQIYLEASSIFNLENFWTIVRVNKAGFGKEMKDLGFPIMMADNLWVRFRFPVMRVTVIFPGLHDQGKCDAFLIATIHLKQLVRVLWTAKGSSEIVVLIEVQPRLTNNSPSERRLLRPFFQLVGIKKVIVTGVSNQRHIAQLRSAITTGINVAQTHIFLMGSIRFLRECVTAQRWEDAMVQTERHSIFIADCRIVFGNRLFGIESGLDVNTTMGRRRTAVEIFVATALANAEITLHLQIYTKAIRFASKALTYISLEHVYYATIAATLGIIAPVHHYALLPLNGTAASLNQFKCYMLCLRARAYIGNGKASRAARDINDARELMPTSVMLAAVFEDWRARFGSVARSVGFQRYDK